MCFWFVCMLWKSVNLVCELNHKKKKISNCLNAPISIMCLFDWSKFRAYGFLIVWQIWWVCIASNPIKFIRMSKNKHYCHTVTHTYTRSHKTPHWHYVFMPIKLPFIAKGLFPKHTKKRYTHFSIDCTQFLCVFGFVMPSSQYSPFVCRNGKKVYGQKWICVDFGVACLWFYVCIKRQHNKMKIDAHKNQKFNTNFQLKFVAFVSSTSISSFFVVSRLLVGEK